MFSSGPNYTKLKTNLRLCINRLKLLEKKKSEMALKSRKEIADYIGTGKTERAKIRVEHIIREDYMVEAMEVLEMYCDLLLARFGLVQQMKTLDDGLAEAISSIIWVAPRMQTDVAELKVVAEQLAAKYGKPYAQACRENAVGTVSPKLMHKLSVQAPPKITVEKYLIEIARYYNVVYDPDPQVMQQEEVYSADNLIELMPSIPNKNDLDSNGAGGQGGGGGGGGFVEPSYPQPYHNGGAAPPPFNYPTPHGAGFPAIPGQAGAAGGPPMYPSAGVPFPVGYPPAATGGFPLPPPPSQAAPLPPGASAPFNYNIPAARPESPNDNVESKEELNISDGSGPPPYEEEKKRDQPAAHQVSKADLLDFPELPSVPADTPVGSNTPQDDDDDIDFDDLTKRFEALKKKK